MNFAVAHHDLLPALGIATALRRLQSLNPLGPVSQSLMQLNEKQGS